MRPKETFDSKCPFHIKSEIKMIFKDKKERKPSANFLQLSSSDSLFTNF